MNPNALISIALGVSVEEVNAAMQSISSIGYELSSDARQRLNEDLVKLGIVESDTVIDEDSHPFFSAYLSFEIDCYNFWEPIGRAARSFWFNTQKQDGDLI